MREIKFRAYNEITGKMVSVNTLCGRYVWDDAIDPVHDTAERMIDTAYDIEDKTHLMQFTGLFDKNKKPIYEGDILQFLYGVQGEDGGEKTIGVVQWHTCSFYLRYGYGGKELSGMDGNNEICWSEEWVRCSEPRGYYKLKEFEVIGNIHEHSHLIKG